MNKKQQFDETVSVLEDALKKVQSGEVKKVFLIKIASNGGFMLDGSTTDLEAAGYLNLASMALYEGMRESEEETDSEQKNPATN